MAKYENTAYLTLPTNDDIDILTKSFTSRYVIDKAVSLTTDVNINLTETPREGAGIEVLLLGQTNLDGSTLTVFGSNFNSLANEDLFIKAVYVNSAWRISTSNLNTYTLGDDDVTTSRLANSAVTTIKIADDAVSPEKLLHKNEIVSTTVTLNSDSVTRRVYVPYNAILKYVQYYTTEAFDATINDVDFTLNIDGLGTTTSYPLKFATSASPIGANISNRLLTSPVVGVDTVGSTDQSYIEIELSQTANQGGEVIFYFILERVTI